MSNTLLQLITDTIHDCAVTIEAVDGTWCGWSDGLVRPIIVEGETPYHVRMAMMSIIERQFDEGECMTAAALQMEQGL